MKKKKLSLTDKTTGKEEDEKSPFDHPDLRDIEPIGDELYEKTDNMGVLFLRGPDDFYSLKSHVIALRAATREAAPRVKFYFTFKGTKDEKSGEDLAVMFYKGQRKMSLKTNGKNVPHEDIRLFFTPRSEKLFPDDPDGQDIDPDDEDYVVPVNHNNFEEQVVKKATYEKPVLVEYFEENCMMCYLMRPFLNSLHLKLRELKVPLTIRKLGIDRNDFPPGTPITRGTPTFVLYNGTSTPQIWEEFKGPDLLKKIIKHFQLDDEIFSDLKADGDLLLSQRLSGLFDRVLLKKELEELSFLLDTGTPLRPLTPTDPGTEDFDKSELHKTFDNLMAQDVANVDNLLDSHERLKEELKSATCDCIYIGREMAEQVIAAEQQQPDELAEEIIAAQQPDGETNQ